MSVIAFQRPIGSPLHNNASFLSLHKTKLSSTKEILDKLIANKSYVPPILPEPAPLKLEIANISSDLNDISSPDGSPCRSPTKMAIKSPKKGILIKRRIGESSALGPTAKIPNESQGSHLSQYSFGDLSPLKAVSSPQSEYLLGNTYDEPRGTSPTEHAEEDRDRERKTKKVTFESSTFFKTSTNTTMRRRPFMIRGSKTLSGWFSKERVERCNELNQKIAKLTIFKKPMESASPVTGSGFALNDYSPKLFSTGSKPAAPKTQEDNTSTGERSPGKLELKKMPEWAPSYPKSPLKNEKGRDVESASVQVREMPDKKESQPNVMQGNSSERAVVSQIGKRKNPMITPVESIKSSHGLNSPLNFIKVEKKTIRGLFSPQKGP